MVTTLGTVIMITMLCTVIMISTLGTVIMITQRHVITNALGTVIMITKSHVITNMWHHFAHFRVFGLMILGFSNAFIFPSFFVALVTVPSYGYAQMKPIKCDNLCSIETNSDGLYVLRNERITAEIDHLGRITVLTLKGGKRYAHK
jgi:hypothetical protein